MLKFAWNFVKHQTIKYCKCAEFSSYSYREMFFKRYGGSWGWTNFFNDVFLPHHLTLQEYVDFSKNLQIAQMLTDTKTLCTLKSAKDLCVESKNDVSKCEEELSVFCTVESLLYAKKYVLLFWHSFEQWILPKYRHLEQFMNRF